jgi:amino-acid N-acetyltransferase
VADAPATFVLRRATADDDVILRALLSEAGLPFVDVATGQQEFVVATVDGEIAGCVGLELFGSDALLRSLAVRESHRAKGLGDALTNRIVALAGDMGVARLYLLTTTAAPFFACRGFLPADRRTVPEAISKSAQFTGLCPSTAVCMHRAI